MLFSRCVRSAAWTIAAALVLGSGAGCAMYTPQGHFEISKAKVNLESNNFKVRKLGAQADAKRPYLFGFPLGAQAIGIPFTESPDLQARAWEGLSAHWEGDGSCVYHNINEEWTHYGLPLIFIVHQYTITADIYEFTDEYVDYATRGERGL